MFWASSTSQQLGSQAWPRKVENVGKPNFKTDLEIHFGPKLNNHICQDTSGNSTHPLSKDAQKHTVCATNVPQMLGTNLAYLCEVVQGILPRCGLNSALAKLANPQNHRAPPNSFENDKFSLDRTTPKIHRPEPAWNEIIRCKIQTMAKVCKRQKTKSKGLRLGLLHEEWILISPSKLQTPKSKRHSFGAAT